MREAYIVKAYRTAVGKAPRGFFKFKRPDELAAETIEYLISQIPGFDKTQIDDLIVGNAMPEAEQGFNVARLISLMGLKVDDVPGVTINRFCASGLETIAVATAKIRSGMSECIIAGGVESMSYIPMTGFKPVPNYNTVSKGKEDYYWGMGLTAEEVANQYSVSREDQDKFAYESHQKAVKALEEKKFDSQIAPITVNEVYLDENLKKKERQTTFNQDQGPRKDTSIEALSKLRPVFSSTGSVTAGNSSQMSDGAAFVMIVSEDMLKKLNIEPIAKLVSYSVAGLPPKIMGMGPVNASRKALDKAGWSVKDLDLVEANEAFAAQALAVNQDMGWDPEIVNVNGGAIAIGHPIGASGARILNTLLFEMKRRDVKRGLATLCIGGGMGVAMCLER